MAGADSVPGLARGPSTERGLKWPLPPEAHSGERQGDPDAQRVECMKGGAKDCEDPQGELGGGAGTALSLGVLEDFLEERAPELGPREDQQK